MRTRCSEVSRGACLARDFSNGYYSFGEGKDGMRPDTGAEFSGESGEECEIFEFGV